MELMHALEMLGLEVTCSEMEVGRNADHGAVSCAPELKVILHRPSLLIFEFSKKQTFAWMKFSNPFCCLLHQEAVEAVDSDGSGSLEFPEFKIVRKKSVAMPEPQRPRPDLLYFIVVHSRC